MITKTKMKMMTIYNQQLTQEQVYKRIERAKIEDVKIRPVMNKIKNLLLEIASK